MKTTKYLVISNVLTKERIGVTLTSLETNKEIGHIEVCMFITLCQAFKQDEILRFDYFSEKSKEDNPDDDVLTAKECNDSIENLIRYGYVMMVDFEDVGLIKTI